MARQQTDKIAFLICKEGATILDEFYAGICEGVMCQVNSTAYQLLISTADEWQRTAQSKQIEGVILAGDAKASLISQFQRQNIPVVLVNNRASGFDLPCVVADEADGVRQVIAHLAGTGHRRIAMLVGRFSPYITGTRYNAFLSAMAERGLPVEESGVMMCGRDIQSATEAALDLLSRPDRPTAVFAFNDVLAAGVMKAARRLGLEVPKDLAVAGFDDSTICGMLEPELSSAHVDCRRMGELSMERMSALLDGSGDVPRLTVVPVSLRPRGSSKSI